MTLPCTRKHDRWRFCGRILSAWLPVAQAPDSAMLQDHLGQQHPNEVTRYVDRMQRTEDMAWVAAQVFAVTTGERHTSWTGIAGPCLYRMEPWH